MNKNIEQNANDLNSMTIRDLKDSLALECNLAILRRALEMAKSGQGYGSGVTAVRLIQARINKLEKGVKK